MENLPIIPPSIDPRSGFCSITKVYHSLRPDAPLPPETTPLSLTSYVFSLLRQKPTSAVSAYADVSTGKRFLHSELEFRVKSLAYNLQQRFGLSRGDCAFILSFNSPEIPILYFSLLYIGVIVSPSNPTSSPSEISHQTDLSKPVVAFSISSAANKLPSYLRQRTLLLDSPEFDSMMIPNTHVNQIKGADQVMQSDTAVILYSSGTSGRVKGVELSHRNFIAVIAGEQGRPPRKLPAVYYCGVPFFHIYGFLFIIREVALGNTLVSMNRFDLIKLFKAIEKYKITNLALAPPTIMLIVNKVELAAGYDLSSLEVVHCGGAALATSVIDKLIERFPKVVVAQAFGLTETTGGCARPMGPNDCREKPGAVGRVVPNCRAKIVDPETGLGLPPLTQGEFWISGPSIMKGYLNNKEATAASLTSDGWFKTGDICYFDKEGRLYYVDRIKELIKYKGYQVAPAELDYILLSHPEIIDAAVVPYPDEEAGQIPVAFVVRKAGSSIDEKCIMDFVAKQVSPYKKVRKVYFINSIPKNAPGKVMRKELVKLAASGASSKL